VERSPASVASLPDLPPGGGVRPRKERSRNPFAIVLRVSAWMIVLVGVVAGVGVLLFIHRGDAEGSSRVANRELEHLLQPGETIENRAPVLQRNWWDYFRVTHGVLAATNRRLVYVGVPPEAVLPREPEPQLLEQSAFPYDRPIDIWRGKVFLGTVNGIIIRAPEQMRTFGVVSSERPRLDSVLANMRRRQAAIREAAERERQDALALAERTRRPVFHVVQRGEALELLARQYNVSVEQLQGWNNLPDPRIRIGQSLLVKPRT